MEKQSVIFGALALFGAYSGFKLVQKRVEKTKKAVNEAIETGKKVLFGSAAVIGAYSAYRLFNMVKGKINERV